MAHKEKHIRALEMQTLLLDKDDKKASIKLIFQMNV